MWTEQSTAVKRNTKVYFYSYVSCITRIVNWECLWEIWIWNTCKYCHQVANYSHVSHHFSCLSPVWCRILPRVHLQLVDCIQILCLEAWHCFLLVSLRLLRRNCATPVVTIGESCWVLVSIGEYWWVLVSTVWVSVGEYWWLQTRKWCCPVCVRFVWSDPAVRPPLSPFF